MKTLYTSLAAVLLSTTTLTAFAQSDVNVEKAAPRICNYQSANTENVTANELLAFVEQNSEFISAANGMFHHFKYNRMARTQLEKAGYVSCVSLIKIGARDYNNGNSFGDYLVQIAYAKPGSNHAEYVLTGLYKAGSVQSFETTTNVKQYPWYMMDARDTTSYLESMIGKLNFVESVVKVGAEFNPVAFVKKQKLMETATTSTMVYDDQGVTYTPLYESDICTTCDKYFLVAWGTKNLASKRISQNGLVLKVAPDGHVSWSDFNIKDAYTGFEIIRDQTNPIPGDPNITEFSQITDYILRDSKL